MTRLGAVTGWLALLLAVTGSDASAELIERTADGTTNLYTWAFRSDDPRLAHRLLP